MVGELSKDYRIVREVGPTTMRLRGALTNLSPANRPMNLVTTVVPVGRTLAETQRLTAGISTFSANGSGEMELVDSVTSFWRCRTRATRARGQPHP